MASNRIPLWQLTRDPAIIAFLKRGAGDMREPAVAKPRRPRNLIGGEAVCLAFDEPGERGEADRALSVHLGRGRAFSARVLEEA